MVKKLIKHEFIYYARTFIIILPVMLFSGIITRIIQFFENDSIAYQLGFSSSISILYFASIVCIFMSILLGIIRFYKNMYSAEGYLTFTLPVSNSSHIISKLIAFLSCQIVSWLILIISWVIAFSGVGNIWNDIFDINSIFSGIGDGHLVLLIFETVIFMLVGIINNALLYYACISVGQLAKKNRIFLAIVAYYVYFVVIQIIFTILIIMLINIAGNFSFENLEMLISNNPLNFIHIMFWIIIVLNAGFAYLFYSITLYIMRKKLNLE